MRPVPVHGEQLLNEARNCTFSQPVTAYLTEARIIAFSCIGVAHRHIRADPVSGGLQMDAGFAHRTSCVSDRKEGSGCSIHALAVSMSSHRSALMTVISR